MCSVATRPSLSRARSRRPTPRRTRGRRERPPPSFATRTPSRGRTATSTSSAGRRTADAHRERRDLHAIDRLRGRRLPTFRRLGSGSEPRRRATGASSPSAAARRERRPTWSRSTRLNRRAGRLDRACRRRGFAWRPSPVPMDSFTQSVDATRNGAPRRRRGARPGKGHLDDRPVAPERATGSPRRWRRTVGSSRSAASTRTVSDSVEALSIGGAWATVTPLPEARGWLAATTLPDGRVHAIGGSVDTGSGQPPLLATMFSFDPAAKAWPNQRPLSFVRQN